MFLSTNGGLCAIGMRGEQLGHHGIIHLLAVVGQMDVVLLIDGLQLSVESTDGHILKAVGLYLQPVVHLVGGNVLGVARHVEPGVGIGALSTDGRHHLVILVRDEVLGGLLRHAVNRAIGLAALSRVGQLAIILVALLNVIQQGCFGLGVSDTELVSTLEHQMFQVVGQACSLGGVVLGTRAHGNVCLNARLFLVDTEVDFQSVVERVDARLRQVTLDFLILVLAATRQEHSNAHDTGTGFHPCSRLHHLLHLICFIVILRSPLRGRAWR